MKEIAKAFQPKEIEKKWTLLWKEKKFFQANPASSKKPFCIVIPPPNVTGSLHMGHALVDTLQDILIRYKRMDGYEALWVPGTDHAGIATQTIVEKHLMATLGKGRRDFSREEFLSLVWKWKEEKEGMILSQIEKLGSSCDWSRLCFTMDEKRSSAVRSVFKKMYDDKLIYQGDYLIHWDTVTQTALADDEVEYEEEASFLWYFRYPLVDQKSFITIATTRPETLLGDSAVAVSPQDPRYKSFVGKEILLPFVHRKIPIIADPFVEKEFGSGAVKITPAHDFVDYEIGKNHSLPLINIMTPDGKVNERGGEFAGLSMQEARKSIVEKMKKLHLFEKIEPYTTKIGRSYRSKAIVEPFLSKQWFVHMEPFKKKLLKAIKNKKVSLVPSSWENVYTHWIENLRPWCISRQLWWGHRIPVWYHKKTKEKICYAGKGLPPEVEKDPEHWFQDEDVLDTWFSSALWPFSALGWPENTPELKKFYPTSTLITGHDILFFWVARMILMGEYVMGKMPFPEVFLHGLIYGKSYWRMDKDGSCSYVKQEERICFDRKEKLPSEVHYKWEKMSKSKGNVIDPLEIIDEYGCDAMRIALASCASQARQIDLDRRRFEEYKNFANKIWNGARFVFLHLEENAEKNLSSLSLEAFQKGLDPALLTLEDRWILSILQKTITKIRTALNQYNFDQAVTLPYEFFWDSFCSYYLELAKPILFGNEGTFALRENKQKILAILLCATLRLLHPIAPFITEELFSLLQSRLKISSAIFPKKASDPYTQEALDALLSAACTVAPYPKALAVAKKDASLEKDFSLLAEYVRTLRNIRTEMQLPQGEKIDLYLYGNDLSLLQGNQHILKTLAKVENLYFIDEEAKLPQQGALSTLANVKMVVPIPEHLLQKECARLKKEQEKLQKLYDQTKEKLFFQEFSTKAPPHIVEKMSETLAQTEKQLQEIEKKLASYH